MLHFAPLYVFFGNLPRCRCRHMCYAVAGTGLHDCNELASHCIMSSDTSGEFEYIVWLVQYRICKPFE